MREMIDAGGVGRQGGDAGKGVRLGRDEGLRRRMKNPRSQNRDLCNPAPILGVRDLGAAMFTKRIHLLTYIQPIFGIPISVFKPVAKVVEHRTEAF